MYPLGERGFRPLAPTPDSLKREFWSELKFEVPVVEVFEECGFPLQEELVEMLRESAGHRFIPLTHENNRKGSGFLQATRLLAERIYQKDAERDVRAVVHRSLLTHILPRLLREADDEYRPQLEDLLTRSKALLLERKHLQDELLSSKEKNIDRQATGDANMLISTTVVEVGVDVPNANVMYVKGAERFGLAQLHQLRGGGNIFGTEQSGFDQFKLGTMHDIDLMSHAKNFAKDILDESPDLTVYPALRERARLCR